MDNPLVSLITPSYNQGQFLEQAIRSVLDQDYPNIEYIIIDGGSSDQSVEIIQRYANRLAYWVSEPDRGQAHAINKGLAIAKGKILGWLNADDVLLSNTVKQVVAFLQSQPDVDVVYGHLERINVQGDRVPTPDLPKDRNTFGPENLLIECSVNQPGSFWKRPIMEKVGPLNEDLRYGLDYEYWIRMVLEGASFHRLPETVAAFRLSPGSKTVGETSKMAIESIGIINHFAAQTDIPKKLGLSSEQFLRQARRGRSLMSLYAFYGCLKDRRWFEAFRWFIRAQIADPMILLKRPWPALAWAGFSRRIFRSKRQ